MEGRCCLIILETFQYSAVNDNLMVLKFSTYYSKCVVDEMVVNVDLGESMAGSCRDPLLVDVIIHHDRSPGSSDTLFWPFVTHDGVDSCLPDFKLPPERLPGQ